MGGLEVNREGEHPVIATVTECHLMLAPRFGVSIYA